ncbi:hypothetical protein X777_11391 [Ooceraea biroi]|uniref:Ionotropic glutamate receptor C-terminal domain-containing protein n=1 Tax=Ooceraea biroi TaxID=2015173 RepID=A0A026W1K3_OOCBI|nr:hypothetical protein X777_11391 [Ooceraea biroi]
MGEMNYIGLCWSSKIPEHWSFTSMRSIPTIRLEVPVSDINETFYPRDIYYNNPFRYNKLHAFVLFVSSPSDLTGLIRKLMASIWWNPLAFYAIVDTTSVTCNQPESYLSIVWKLDLETSSFFCVDSDKENAVYTYNRFGNPAPKAWQVDLNFDKKSTVGGYTMRLVGGLSPSTLTVDQGNGTKTSYGGLDGLILTTLFDKMNATMSATMLETNTKFHLLLQNVSANEYDMLMNAQYIFNKPNYTMTYPHIESGISSLTKPSGFDSNGVKILKFMTPQLILGILAVSAITVFILSKVADERTNSACLEVLRMATNVSILHLPRGTSLRIYLIIVMLMFVITSSIFQGGLSALLTSSTSRPNIDDAEQLKEAGYPVYMYSAYMNAVFDPVLRSHVRKTDNWDCSEYVIKYSDTACVADRNRVTRIAFEKGLHVARHRITSLYMGYVVRPNFPLVKRIGQRLMSISQAGLANYWREKTVVVYKNKLIIKEQEMKRKQYRALHVSDVMFAFYILFVGLSIAILVFLSELLPVTRWGGLRKKKQG